MAMITITDFLPGRHRSGAPRLKKPHTQADFDAIFLAQVKRDRKAAKLERENFIQRCMYYVTRDVAVAEEARRVHDLFGAERVA